MVVAAWNSHNALKILVDKILSSSYVWHHSILPQATVRSLFPQSLTPSPRDFQDQCSWFFLVEDGEASATGSNMTGGEEKEPNPSDAGGKGSSRKRLREWSYKAVTTSTHFCFLFFPFCYVLCFFIFGLCMSFHIWRVLFYQDTYDLDIYQK